MKVPQIGVQSAILNKQSIEHSQGQTAFGMKIVIEPPKRPWYLPFAKNAMSKYEGIVQSTNGNIDMFFETVYADLKRRDAELKNFALKHVFKNYDTAELKLTMNTGKHDIASIPVLTDANGVSGKGLPLVPNAPDKSVGPSIKAAIGDYILNVVKDFKI